MPSPGYKVTANQPRPGTAWVYLYPNGIAALKFDDVNILTGTSKGIYEITDLDHGLALTNHILDSSAAGLSIQQALERIQEAFGKPDIVLPLPNINDPGDAIRAAVESHR